MKDAQAGRANAYKIAKLQADVSRYGIDMQRKTALDQLKENARQFDASHALEMERFAFDKEKFGKEFGLEEKKFGLNYADTATEYLSSPDRFAQGMDFRLMADRALIGANGGGETPQGPQPYGSGVTFTPKTEQDFAVLAGYGRTPQEGQPLAPAASSGWFPGAGAVPSSPAPSGPSSPQMGGQTPAPAGTGDADMRYALEGPSAWTPGPGGPPRSDDGQVGINPVNGDGTPRPAPDPRVKVIKQLFDAMPPSQTPGYDENDLAVMEAAKALMGTNLQPGTLQRMRPDQKKIYGSFIRRSGRSVDDYLDQYQAQAPNQRSVRAY
jgi:hypothetical protein